MACATAVVASDVGGIPEVVVDGETGLLVHYDEADPDALRGRPGRRRQRAGRRSGARPRRWARPAGSGRSTSSAGTPRPAGRSTSTSRWSVRREAGDDPPRRRAAAPSASTATRRRCSTPPTSVPCWPTRTGGPRGRGGRADARRRRPRLRAADPAARTRSSASGSNYRAHLAEMGRELPAYPTVFAKYRSSLIGAHDDIVLPAVSDMVDWEAELAVVIGAPIRHGDADRGRGGDRRVRRPQRRVGPRLAEPHDPVPPGQDVRVVDAARAVAGDARRARRAARARSSASPARSTARSCRTPTPVTCCSTP